MNNDISLSVGSSSDLFFIMIIIIAAGLGIYGILMLLNLSKKVNYRLQDQQVDKLLIGSVNIAISIICICLIISITKINAHLAFTQADKLLGQIK